MERKLHESEVIKSTAGDDRYLSRTLATVCSVEVEPTGETPLERSSFVVWPMLEVTADVMSCPGMELPRRWRESLLKVV